jgi:formylglycine-generating enzyme required for sulfatase activity
MRRRTLRGYALVGGLALAVIAVLAGWYNESYLQERLNWFMIIRPYMLANIRPRGLTAEAERALKPKDSFRECSQYCPEMIVVQAGAFAMGSPVTEPDRGAGKDPQHKVMIAMPFAVSKFDVTFADWDACVWLGGCPPVGDSRFGRGAKPVINVSWEDAQHYVEWLSKFTGQPYRLLTEAEWEYAARAGTTTAYYWGEEIGEGNANCDGCGSEWDNRETPPVGSFKPNPFGLYDMAGNVWQWVEDCYHDNYDDAPADGSAWTSGDCSLRVVRGGSWDNGPQNLRAAVRIRSTDDDRDDVVGFRLARTLNP